MSVSTAPPMAPPSGGGLCGGGERSRPPSGGVAPLDPNYQGYDEEQEKLSPLGVGPAGLGPIGPPSRYNVLQSFVWI